MSTLADRLFGYARVAEALAFLIVAQVLVIVVPMKIWRASLGRIGGSIEDNADTLPARRSARAVTRAATWLPWKSVCLPRAMALQWMLGRRGLHSALIFGVLPETDRSASRALHAWVEADGHILTGDDGDLRWHKGLVLAR